MRSFALTIGLWFYAVSFVIHAQSLTLQSAIHSALIHNIEIQKIYLDCILYKDNLDYQLKHYRPKLTLNAQGTTHENEQLGVHRSRLFKVYPSLKVSTPIGTELQILAEASKEHTDLSHHDESITLILKQPLTKGLNPKINNFSLQEAKRQYMLEKWQVQQAVEQVMIKIIMQFFMYQQKTLILKTQQKHLDRAQLLVYQLNEKLQAGRIAQNELLAPRLQVQVAKQAVIQSQYDVDESRAKLFEIIGINDTQQEIELNIPQICIPTDSRLMGDILENDLPLKTTEIMEQRFKEELLITKDSHRMDINLQGDFHLGHSHYHRYENIADSPLFHVLNKTNKGYTASINLELPIGNQHQKHNQLLKIHTNIQKAKLEKKQRKQLLTNQKRSLMNELHLQEQQILLIQQEGHLAQLDYESMRELYEVGRATVHELVNAEDKVQQVEVRLTMARQKLQEIKLQIQQLAGCLLPRWQVRLTL